MSFLAVLQRLFSILSLALLGVGGYLIWSWWDLHGLTPSGWPWREVGGEDWRLYLGGALFVWSFLGSLPMRLMLGRAPLGTGRLRGEPGEAIPAPDGLWLHVEAEGPVDAPVLIFTHGWGMDSSTWADARRRLAERYRVIVWDLPGLGRSKGPNDGRYSLERFADALGVVTDLAGRRQVVLVGHSIGGMIIQTLARNQPQRMGTQVVGVVLANTTHVDPLHTTFLSGLLRPLEPMLKALMHLDVWLFPLVWAMNWQSYLSGSTHLAMRLGGFGTQPPRDLLEQVSWLATLNSPAVQAKGNLAMMRWDGTRDLPSLTTPALVFAGGRDLVTRPEAGATIAARAPAAQLHSVQEAGHMGPQECSEAYCAAIAAFADQVFTRRAISADGRPASPTSGGGDDRIVDSPPHISASQASD